MAVTDQGLGRGDFGRRDRATVGSAIAEFIRAAENGRAHGASGEPYTRAELRELRAALSHVDAELGSVALPSLRRRDVGALLDDLRDGGLSERRETAIVGALGSLYAYTDESPRERPPQGRTPTDAMLAIGEKLAFWSSATIFVLFAGVLLLLVVALA